MVFRKTARRLVGDRSKKSNHSAAADECQGFSPGRTKAHNKKNQLLHPISPYDELPDIQDLVDKLTPISTSAVHNVRGVPQERQQHGPTQPRSSDELQQRDPPIASPFHDSYRNGAHDVPAVIEIPCIPTPSQDSEMTVDDIFRPTTRDDRGPRSLTPHPSFEDEVHPTASDVRYLVGAGTKADQEAWPSDEESAAAGSCNRRAEENMTWTNGSMYVWNLDGRNGKNALFPDRRKKEC
jgi:hypothetical protein